MLLSCLNIQHNIIIVNTSEIWISTYRKGKTIIKIIYNLTKETLNIDCEIYENISFS